MSLSISGARQERSFFLFFFYGKKVRLNYVLVFFNATFSIVSFRFHACSPGKECEIEGLLLTSTL